MGDNWLEVDSKLDTKIPSDKQRKVDERFNSEVDFWNEVYSKNDLLAYILKQRQTAALDFVDSLPLPIGSRVLEIGCGAGILAVELAQRGFTLNAVDHAEAMVQHTRKLLKRKKIDGTASASIEDAHRLTFSDSTFDLVVAVGVTHWLHNLPQALKEITRVLKPKGYAVLSLDTRWFTKVDLPVAMRGKLLNGFQQIGLLSRQPKVSEGPIWYPAKLFRQYLEEAKLRPVRSKTLGFLPFKLFNKQILSNGTSMKVSLKLQKYADSRLPILRSQGAIYIGLLQNSK